MARPLRIEYPGALYHVTSRGNARQAIFLGDGDRSCFLAVLGEVVNTHRWRCHAYCLMTNHYHLLLDTPEANLSRGMRQLNGLYTQRFNRRHERIGHVFQGRYSGILVEREAHLLELARYVVLNPVRAGLVHRAEEYRWSSLRATLGLAYTPAWLSVDPLLTPFGTRERYLEYVHEGRGAASPWTGLRGSVLGSESFAERIGAHARASALEREIPRRERAACRKKLDELFPLALVRDRAARNRRIREVARTRQYTLSEIARHLGLHYSTVSKLGVAGVRLTPEPGTGPPHPNPRPDPFS